MAFGFQMIMWLGKSTLETNLEHIFYFVYWITSRPIEEYFQAKSVSNKVIKLNFSNNHDISI